ncbi:MAG: metallophosphoesterase [Actinomycetota bacterium]|nr:metallophosphoesterase [Actinomycetota bacterium]
MTVIAHLSDTHLDSTAERTARFERVTRELELLLQLDALIVTGDLTDHGDPAEYRAFFDVLPSHVPTLVVPGNHDNRDGLRPYLQGLKPGEALNTVLELDGGTVIGLDSLVEGEDRGELTEETLAFADRAISTATGWVVLAMHHPAVPVGHPVMDQHGLTNGNDLADLIGASDKVVACFVGHVHSALAASFADRPLIGAPGIASTMRLGGRHDPIADARAMPGLVVHNVADDWHLSSVFHYLSPTA